MLFRVGLDDLLEPLQLVLGAVERKQLLPILSFLYCRVSNSSLTMVGADQEIEIAVTCDVVSEEEAEFTLPGRKLLEICRNLDAGSTLEFELGGAAVELRSGRFRSQLAVLPPLEFPRVDLQAPKLSLKMPAPELKRLMERVSFAMAQQDVRFFFNGMLLEFSETALKVVATNGQRLAFAKQQMSCPGAYQAILPRKAVLEALKLLKAEGDVVLNVNKNHFELLTEQNRLVSSLLDAEYPDYTRAIPNQQPFTMTTDRVSLRSALTRISILSNELYRNVRLKLDGAELQLAANNPQQEEAEEHLAVEYAGEEIEIGFNVAYLTEILSVLEGESVQVTLNDGASPIVMQDCSPGESQQSALYVVSPMVL